MGFDQHKLIEFGNASDDNGLDVLYFVECFKIYMYYIITNFDNGNYYNMMEYLGHGSWKQKYVRDKLGWNKILCDM